MTREEAMQRLSDLQDGSGQTYEAIRMAIESLSAEPSGDLISREELLKKLDRQIEWEEAKAIPYEDADGGCILGLKKARKYVKLASSTEKPIANDCDLISRQTLIGAIEKCGEEKIYPQALIETIKALPSADVVEVKAEQLPPKVPTKWINEGMVLVPKHDWIEMQKKLEEYVSADRPKVAYICDGRKCDKDCSECFRTLDIEHARDFKLLGGTYYQQESADRPSNVLQEKKPTPIEDYMIGKSRSADRPQVNSDSAEE